MTVNYTTLLALGQPVTGTETGTWGDDVNNAITSYLDIAIAGTLSLTSANFTAGALTLANTQGTSSATNISGTTAQYAVLRVSSLAVNSTITAPSSSRIYLVDNADATYTVTIKASGQSGYTVATNTRAWVYFTGTDYVLASTNDITKLVGTLPVASGGTGVTSLTANHVILGNGTSALQVVAPGTNGNVLTSNGTTWTSAAPAITLAGNNAFTGANTFYNATGQTFGTATSTNDGIILTGGAGGSSSYRITLTPATLAASRTLTLPEPGENVTLGYLNIPQNSQSAAYQLVLTDAGKHILHPSADTSARTFTIPANGTVAFPIGTAITFINQNGAGTVTIAITTDTMRLAGAGTTGSRTLAANGVATAIKIATTEWIISGTGLT